MEKKKYDHKEMPRLTPQQPLVTITTGIVDSVIKMISERAGIVEVTWKPSITCGICGEDHHAEEMKHIWKHLGKPMSHHDKFKWLLDDVAESLRRLV